MSEVSVPESILLADCGAVATKVGLIDRVGSEYRLIAAARAITAVEPPAADVSLGVRRAIAQLETLLGRRFLSEAGELIRSEQESGEGVDSFVACTSAALPMRGAVVGLSRDFSVASAMRALTSSYVVVTSAIAVDEESGRWGTTARDGRAGGPSAAVENLASSHPDIIIMVGGVDGGALTPLHELANIIASIGAATDEGERPLVVFAGNKEARAAVAERIGDLMELISVDNVRPTLDQENLAPLREELEAIYSERCLRSIPGLTRLAGWSPQPVIPSLAGYQRTLQFLARRYGLRVLGADLGAATTAIVQTDGYHVSRAVSPDLGLGYGLEAVVKGNGIERLARWLPDSISLEQAHALLLNQALRPWTVPMRAEDRTVLDAAARVILAETAGRLTDEALEADLVILGGAPLARGTSPNALALMALDGLPLRGVYSVVADTAGLAPAMGAVAAVNPEAAAQVLERDVLLTLGPVLIPTLPGQANEGSVLRARVETKSGGKFEVQVNAGSLELLPLGLAEKAHVQIEPEPGVMLGMPLNDGVFRRDVEGGSVGMVIDARGRPLPAARDLAQQRQNAQKWLWEVGA